MSSSLSEAQGRSHVIVLEFPIIDEEADVGDRDASVLKDVFLGSDDAVLHRVVRDDLKGAFRTRHTAEVARDEGSEQARRVGGGGR